MYVAFSRSANYNVIIFLFLTKFVTLLYNWVLRKFSGRKDKNTKTPRV